MNYLVPYIITFITNVTHVYLLACYAFIHNDLMSTFRMNKIQFGIIYGLACIGTIIGTTLFFLFSAKIRQNIITFLSWGSTFFTSLMLLIVIFSVIFQHPHMSILVVIKSLIGISRCIYFPCVVMITKIHEEIAGQKIGSSYNKLLKSIWSTSFDVGIIYGYFVCNWLYYSLGWRWEYLILFGSFIHLLANALNYLVLKPYIQEYKQNTTSQQQIQDKNKNIDQNSNTKKHQVTIPQMLSLLNKNTSSKLFLINTTILQPLHISICFILPPFFYSIGFKGNQGYLVAIYSIFISIGSSFLGLMDFIVENVNKCIQQRNSKNGRQNNLNKQDQNFLQPQNNQINNQINIEKKNQLKTDQGKIFLIISSIFLFLFFIVELIMAKDTFYLKSTGTQHRHLTSSQLSSQMIKVCVLGFFFGGPIKSYLSYRILMVMKQLDQSSQKQKLELQLIRKLQLNCGRSSDQVVKTQTKQGGFCSYFKNHKVELGGAFLATTRITIYTVLTIHYVIIFYLIQQHISYMMVYLCLIGLVAILFDAIQNSYFFRRIKERNLRELQSQID